MAQSRLNIVDRWGNGAYIAEFDGDVMLTEGQTILIGNNTFGTSYSEKKSGSDEHGWQEKGPFLYQLASMICSGQHPDYGKVIIRLNPHKNIDGTKELKVFFNGKPYRMVYRKYQGWMFEPRLYTQREAAHRWLDPDGGQVEAPFHESVNENGWTP